MKKLFLSILTLPCLFFAHSVHAQWTDISLPNIWSLDQASFTDDNHGFVAAASYDKIFRTMNGGGTWDSIMFNGTISGIDFVSNDTGFVLIDSSNTYSLKTTFNNGNSWISNPVPTPGFGYYQNMRFTNSTTGVLFTNDAIVFSTANGGQNWTSPLPIGGYTVPTDREYTGTDTIIFSGWDGTFAYKGAVTRSDDAGATWQTYSHDSLYSEFSGTHFLDGKNGYAVYTTTWPLFNNVLDRTTDGGITWTNVLSDTNSTIYFNDIFMTSATEGYIAVTAGSTGEILKLNGSSTIVDHATTNPLNRFYKGGNTLFAVGDGGKIVKQSLPMWIESNPIPLTGIYPNPTNGVVNIQIESQSEINVLDINGKTVLSKTISPGELLSLTHLANGLYCLRVKNEKGISAGRIILNH